MMQKYVHMKKLILLAMLFLGVGRLMAAPALSVAVRVTGTGNTFYVYVNVKNTAAISTGANNAYNVTVTCPVPSGATFRSATFDGVSNGTTVTWTFPVLGGLNAITPSFSFTIPSGTATIPANSVSVTATSVAAVTAPASPINKNYTAAGATVEVSTTGNDGTAATNILAAGNAFGLPAGSTHPNFPFLTWDEGMRRIKTNNQRCQTLKFRPGVYTDAANNVSSETDRTILAPSFSWTAGNHDGLIIDGQGAELRGGTTSWILINTSSVAISDLTIKNLIFTNYNNTDNPGGVMTIYDCDGLVIDNCIFYNNILYNPVSIIYEDSEDIALTLSNCVFSGNSVNVENTNSGAMELSGTTSATYNNWNVITNTRFTCNRRNGDGGAVAISNGSDYRKSTYNFSNCVFKGNTSSTTGSGGAGLYIGSASSTLNPGSVNLYNTDFIENVLNGSTASLGGQLAVKGNVININGGQYINGGAQSATPGLRGGAMGFQCREILINNVTISGNYASGTTAYGAIFLESGTVAYADNSIITGNLPNTPQTNLAFGASTTITTGTTPTAPPGDRTSCVVYSYFLNITGNVFDDGNGLNDDKVNGPGVTAANAGTLYVAVVSNVTGLVVGYATVNPTTGAYSITDVVSGLATSPNPPTFRLVLSTTIPVVGAAITPSVPNGWQSTGENFGSPSVVGNDGTVNSNLTNFTDLIVNGSSVTNLNLAINKIPLVDDRTSIVQTNPGGTNRTPVHNILTTGGQPIWTATDLETTSFSQINITAFPTNATSFTVGNNTTYYPHPDSIPAVCPTTTCLAFPETGGVNVPTNSAGVPTGLSVDPSFPAAGSVTFPYTATDSAGAVSVQGTATIPFSVSGGGALSVKIDNFQVQAQNCTTKLLWSLISEDNTFKAVEIQRSENGFAFSGLTTLYNHSGTYYDHPSLKTIHYRLKITEQDGSVTYSAIKTVHTNCTDDFKVTLMGNPVQQSMGIRFFSALQHRTEYAVEDITGKTYIRKSITVPAGTYMINESLSHLAEGVYYLRVMAPGTSTKAIKFIKQ
jgi:hypothetical protein